MSHVVTIRGRLTELSQPVGGQTVSIRAGRRFYRVRTDPLGTFQLKLRVAKPTRLGLYAEATVAARELAACAESSPAPGGCVSRTRAFYSVGSPFVWARVH